MKKKNGQDTVMTRYLLGELPEEEQLRLEEQFFTDEDLYQQLLALEDELKYEYAQGGLSPRQRKAFEERFLRSEADRQKVAVAGAVLAKAYEVSAQRSAAAPLQEKPHWTQALANFFMPRTPALRFASAAAALAILVVGAWSMYQAAQLRNRLERLEAQRRAEEQSARQELARERDRRAELERRLSNRPQPDAFMSFVLTPGLVRDADGQKPLLIPADAGSVLLQLDLKQKAGYKAYRAEVQTLDGKRIWSQDLSSPRLTIPGRLLAPDDYVISLKGITPKGEQEDAGEYYFTVVRK